MDLVKSKDELKLGDFVCYKEDKTTRSRWFLGQVGELDVTRFKEIQKPRTKDEASEIVGLFKCVIDDNYEGYIFKILIGFIIVTCSPLLLINSCTKNKERYRKELKLYEGGMEVLFTKRCRKANKYTPHSGIGKNIDYYNIHITTFNKDKLNNKIAENRIYKLTKREATLEAL
jgi:hypothetical protein